MRRKRKGEEEEEKYVKEKDKKKLNDEEMKEGRPSQLRNVASHVSFPYQSPHVVGPINANILSSAGKVCELEPGAIFLKKTRLRIQ